MSSPTLRHEFEWTGPSADPADVQFGDVVEARTLAELPDLDEGSTVLLGEPYDEAVVGRPGAAGGPGAIREALAGVKTHHFDAGPVGDASDAGDVSGTGEVGGVDDTGGSGGSIFDLGDVDFRGVAGVAMAQGLAREVARDLHGSDAIPVFLGGDNSMTVANAGGLLDAVRSGGSTPGESSGESFGESLGESPGESLGESSGESPGESPGESHGSHGSSTDRSAGVGVCNFDAHLDVREVREEPTSGTPYRQLYDEGLADYACVGARHFETSTGYHDFVREREGTVVTSEEVADDPVDAVGRALDALDVDHLLVSVDLDVLDATAAPGVSAPTPGGVTTRELFRMVRVAAGDPRVAGLEVVECAPPLDDEGRTVAAAARTVAHFLAAVGVDA